MFKGFNKTERIVATIIAALAILLLVSAMVSKAHAQFEANRAPLAYAGGGVRLLSVSASSHRDLPKGYTLWSGDGAEFWVTRFASSGVLESVPMKVPANTPITITAPPAFNSGGTWYQAAYINASSVTDSVYVLPLDK